MAHRSEAKTRLERSKEKALAAIGVAAAAVKEVVTDESHILEEKVQGHYAAAKTSVGNTVEDVGQWIKK